MLLDLDDPMPRCQPGDRDIIVELHDLSEGAFDFDRSLHLKNAVNVVDDDKALALLFAKTLLDI